MIIPRGVIHGFTNVGHGFTNVGIGEARHILVSTPRRHEEFFLDLHSIPQPRKEHMDQLPAIAGRGCDDGHHARRRIGRWLVAGTLGGWRAQSLP
ncbi:hypothetical protein ABID62_009765, partial [Bradyrhizobium sp. S3.9.1]